MLLDERALRRPEFQDGQEVVMSDGQGWTLPFPVVVGTGAFPLYAPDGEFMQIVPRVVLDGDLDTILEDAAFGEPHEVEAAVMRAGVQLLINNYTLTRRQAARLVQLRTNDPANQARYDGIFQTLIGERSDPKPSAVGEPPASSPTESPASPPTSRPT